MTLFIAFIGIVFAIRAFVFPKDALDIDFSSYWAAARTVWSDDVSPYGLEAPKLARERWLPGLLEPVPPFIYTPAALLLFGPLQWLEPLAASRLMVGLSILAAAVMALFLVRTLDLGSSRRVAWACGLYALVFVPLYETIGLGQVNLLLALLLLGTWHVYRNNRAPVAGGLAAALVVFLKLHLGILLLPAFLRRRVSLLVASAVSLVAGIGLSAAVLPSNIWGEWIHHVVRASSIVRLPPGVPPIEVTRNLSIAGMTARVLAPRQYAPLVDVPPWMISTVPSLLCGLVLAWTAVVLWRSSRVAHTPERADAEICLAIATAFEVSPLSWGHHLVFLLPVLLLLLRHGVLGQESSRTTRAVLALSLFLLLLHPFLLGPMTPAVAVTVATLRALAALVVWGAASARVLRLAQPQATEVVSSVPTSA